MPYHRLDANLYDPNLAIQGEAPDYGVPWSMGVPFRKAVPEPVRCGLDPRGGPTLPDLFLTDIPLFSDRLLATLTSVGVDNLVTFRAEVEDRGGQIHANYKAVNILGAVSCADLKQSEYVEGNEPPLMEFTMLVLDEPRAHGQRLFRLAECTRIILVDDEVKAAVEAVSLVGVRIVPIEYAAY